MNDLDYVARCQKCNRLVGAMCSTLLPKDIAKGLSNWARSGLSIERMATEDVRDADWGHRAECKTAARKGMTQRMLL